MRIIGDIILMDLSLQKYWDLPEAIIRGIIGLEVKYDEILKGEPGKILTVTDARGVEIDGTGERRKEPVSGNTLRTSLDVNIQEYVQQAAGKVMEEKQAEKEYPYYL